MLTLIIFAFLAASPPAAHASGPGYEVIYSGRSDSRPEAGSALLLDQRSLDAAAGLLGITGPLSSVDFKTGGVLLVIPDEPSGGVVEILSVDSVGGVIEVLYSSPFVGPPRQDGESYPYLLARISPLPEGVVTARFSSPGAAPAAPAETSIGQLGKYTNVLSQADNIPLVEYMPLDKGNEWTYAYESPSQSGEITNRIISESDGWSVFEKFFGVPGAAMRIPPGGEVLIASKGGGTRTFYTEDVVTGFPKEPVKTPAGEFGDLMVVTSPEGGEFWFRDVYAKGVGLVVHEQKSEKGEVRYMLVNARVAGKNYPAAETAGDNQPR